MLDVSLFGTGPAGHHVTNVLLHAASTLVLFLVFFRMTGARWQSAFVAGVFRLHPLHAQSVAWVAERKDVLSTLLWFLAIGAYAAYAREPGARRFALVLGLLALGPLAKPMLVSAPLVFLLLDVWPLRRWDGTTAAGALRMLREKVPMFVLSPVSALATVIAQRQSGALRSLDKVDVPTRAANALVSYAEYISDTLWPHDLAFYHPLAPHITGAQLAGAALVLAGVGAATLVWCRHRPLAIGWAWFLVTLVPVIGLV